MCGVHLWCGVLALFTPPPPCGSSFFPLLFIAALGPQPAWLPPAISPYHCSGSQPWAPWRQSPLSSSWQGVEGRWGGAPSWGRPVPGRAGLACFLSSRQPLEAQEVLSGQKWQAQERSAASSQPLPLSHPTGGNPASSGSWVAYHQPRPRKEAPKGSRMGAGPPRTAPISGNLGPGSSARATVYSQSFSKPP